MSIPALAAKVFGVPVAEICPHLEAETNGAAFRASAPIIGHDGRRLGTLAIADNKPRPPLTPVEQSILADLAKLAADQAALEELRRSERRLQLLVRSVSSIVWNTTRDGYPCGSQQSWREFTGLEPDEWLEAIHPDDRERTVAEWAASVSSGREFRISYRLRRKDGEYRQTVVAGVPVVEGGTEILEWIGVHTDVTEQARIESALRASEEFNRGILLSSQDCIKILDESARLTFMSDNGQRLLGICDFADVKDARWLEFWHGDDRRKAETALNVALGGGVGRFQGAFPRSGGVPAWWDVVVSRINQGDGRPVRLLAVSREITEQKATEEALRRSNDELQSFAYAAGHDLQEPLRTMRSCVQLFLRRHGSELDAESHKLLDFTTGAAGRMQRLLDDLLIYAQVTASPARERKVVSAPAELRSALDNLGSQIEANGADVRIGDLPDVMAEEGSLIRVFQNLIGNAIKYRRAETAPVIRVNAEKQGNQWIFSVQDNGKGIEAEQLQRIFGLFQRAHGREVAGSGIGLALCQRILERQHGRIWATSSPGEGSTFSFSLPAALS